MKERKAFVLYSGGKDSSLSAVILKNLSYDVELITATFGISDDYKNARKAAEALGFKHSIICIDEEVLRHACDIMIREGFPKNGFNFIHRRVIESVAESFGSGIVIADGIRRDDIAPKLEKSIIRSIEDRYNVSLVSPLYGFSYKEVNYLAEKLFIFNESRTESIKKGDYETEIRKYLKSRRINIRSIFPAKHKQSIVKGWKDEQDILRRKVKIGKSAEAE